MKNERLTYLDGIKGICTLSVVIFHFLLTFYPEGYIGWNCPDEGVINPFNYYFSNFPYSILTNNSFPLYIFMGVSSFIQSYFYFKNNNKQELKNHALKRYFQLMPITLITCIFSVFLYKIGLLPFKDFGILFNNKWILSRETVSNYSFLSALKDGLIFAYIKGTDIHGPLWCVNYFFLGSLFTSTILLLFGNNKHRYSIYIFISMFLYFAPTYLSFLACIVSADIVTHVNQNKNRTIYYLLFFLGLTIGFFPPPILPRNIDIVIFYGLGTFGVILGCSILFKDCKILNLKSLCFIGKKSFSIIIVHFFVLISLNCNLYILFNNLCINKFLNIFINFLIFIPISIILGIYYDKILMPITNALCKKVIIFL